MRKFSEREQRYFSIARELSLTSKHSRYKVGAVLVRKSHILSVGVNSETRSHPLQKHYNRFRKNLTAPPRHYIHAEMEALVNAPRDVDLKDAVIYVYRELSGSRHATARPCEACMEALRDRGVKKICYTTYNGFAFEQILEKV